MTVDVLIGLGLRVSAVLAIALVTVILLRRRSASIRHGVLSAAVAAALILPLAGAVLPAWTIAVPAAWSWRAASPSGASTTNEAALQAAGPAASPARRSETVASPGRSMDWRRAVVTIWMSGVALLLAWLAIGLIRLQRLARRAAEVTDPRWTTGVAAIAEAYAMRVRVRVLESDHAALLVAWGWPRPAILVPRGALAWSDARIRVVLAHELAHIAAGDWAARLGAEVLRAVHWWNPLAWLVASRLRLESELSCDDAVLRLGENDCDYATHLVALAREFGHARHAGWPAPAMARRSSLERRVTAMVDPTRNRTRTTRRTRLAALAAWLLLAAPLATAQQAGPSLSGRVIDQTGRPLAGAEIQVTAPDGTVQQTKTDADGRYAFDALAPGQYSFQARMSAFRQQRAALFLAGRTRTVRDVVLSIGALSEELTVSASSAAASELAGATRPTRDAAEVTPLRQRSCEPPSAGGAVVEPRKIRDVKPRYPTESLLAGVGGVVILEGVVATDGSVRDVKVLREPDTALGTAATDAVQQWRFTPTLLNCEPIEVVVTVTVNFKSGT